MEKKAKLQEIKAELAAARHALRQSLTAYDTAAARIRNARIEGMSAEIDRLQVANRAQRDALNVTITATDKAMRLFFPTDSPGGSS